MSKYHVETTKKTVIDGIEYKADINRDVDIDFSAAKYAIKLWEDAHDAGMELIPDNMDFLCGITDIFPLSEYDIKIKQSIYRHIKPHVSIYLDIRHKETGEKVYFAEGARLSDNDYEYLRDILVKEVPQYKWRTAEKYLRSTIERCLGEDNDGDPLISNDAWVFLCNMVSARYKEIKVNGFVEVDDYAMTKVARKILEEALREAAEQNTGE